ncbi:hypothetical protein QEH44_gp54 [Arthrobacter phage Shambre1]|uniref:Uncharacterized protein n=1 Tax=Arthrobacter phage Shambre1 TaxID=2927284 RepID=A0A977KNM0_9CAUD|nr:hypothetical protein QEH44_gp54 [Arthrobacter phage Shambre1]UXE04790.1 hypothetical protein SEA_SHAMBRE1_54 [Arthrobacter phage Shambre1]
MPSNQPDLDALLLPHVRLAVAGGYYRCGCSHTYEAAIDAHLQPAAAAEQAQIMDYRHAQHVAEQLLSAGVELPKPDPRQALRDRAAALKGRPRA